MKSRSVTRITCLLMAGAMLTGSLFASTEKQTVQTETSKLLKDVQSRATQLAREAEKLETYGRGGITRESHGFQLTLVKDHINAIGLRLEMLQEMRGDAAAWQQLAIDAIVPAAANVAAHTEAAILHLNEFGKSLWHPAYTGHLRAISDHSDQVKETVDLHLELAATQDKLDRLRDRVN
jgi:hypothetical protein